MVKRALLLPTAVVVLAGLLYVLWAGSPQRRAGETRPAQPRRGAERVVTVEAAAVKAGAVEENLRYTGSVAALSLVDVYAKVEGRLEGLYVDVGDPVKRGQLLGRIEREEILEQVKEAEAALKVAEATLKGKRAETKNLKRQLERSQQLLKRDFIARQELDAVQTQYATAQAETELAAAQVAQREAVLEGIRLRLRHTEIQAPIAGYVANRFLDRGAMIKTSAPILSLVDIEKVKTVVAVVETDYGKIRPGMPATMEVDAYSGRVFGGQVARVSPVLDQETRTAEVEIEVPNPQRLLKPGMFARVSIVTGRRTEVTLVPDAALVRRGDGYGLFKVKASSPSLAEFVPVKTGLSGNAWTEVRGSVKPGDLVVTVGSSLLRDGQEVRVVNDTPRLGRKKST